MNKSKLFAICLTVALMARGCANTHTNSQADSQENESSVESIASEVSETSEESQTSETEKSKELSVTLESSETVVVESKEDKPIVEKEKSVGQQKETMVIESSVEPLAVSRETAETSGIYIEESIEHSSKESVILESSVETSVVSEEIIENDDGIWHIIEDSEDEEETEDESEEEYPEIWGIVKEPCVTHEGYEIGKNVYVKIIFNDLALKNRTKYINMEDLSGFDTSQFLLRNWSYYQLQNYITYKAEKYGIIVRKVNPAYTSQTCSCCGFVSAENRPKQEKGQAYFKCVKCGVELNADFNGSQNIARSTDFTDGTKSKSKATKPKKIAV